MNVGWSKLKSMVAGGTPNMGEATLKNLLEKGKTVSVIEHRYLQGWWGLPKDIIAIVLVVRGPATLDNVQYLLIDELQKTLRDPDIEYAWTHVPDKKPSASAIIIHGKTSSLQFERESGLLTISKKYLIKLIKHNSGWKPGTYHVEPEIKKVKII